VPIDHGFCLPEALEPPFFEWLHWPQAMLPFEQAELDYIASLDAAADVQLLRSELPMLRPQCLRVLQVRGGQGESGDMSFAQTMLFGQRVSGRACFPLE
jgi:hypothetical protein